MLDSALVDTAAGQALVGKEDLRIMKEAFAEKGFHIHVHLGEVPGMTASGIGGQARPIGKAWVPVSLAGCGFV
eukprot:4240997-Pyramimonas_sp.AAC.1